MQSANANWQVQNWREPVTLGSRILTFIMALGILGAFWLPWVWIDGLDEASSGIGLIAVLASPQLKYLYSASHINTGFLIGCPIAIVIFGVVVAKQYAQKRTAIFATLTVLVAAVALPYGASGLLAGSQPGFDLGLILVAASASMLLVQQALIKVATSLRRRRRFPSVYRTLAVFTGSGYYRWPET